MNSVSLSKNFYKTQKVKNETNLAHYKISEVIEGFEYDEFEGKGFLDFQENLLYSLNIKETIFIKMKKKMYQL